MEEDNKLQTDDVLPSPPAHTDPSQDTVQVISPVPEDDGLDQNDLPRTLPETALPNHADHDVPELGTAAESDHDDNNTDVPPLPPKYQSEMEAVPASPVEPTRFPETGKAEPQDTRSHTPTSSGDDASHKRSMTISKGHHVSMILITTALETIASSKEARRSVSIRESTQRALELIRSNQGGDRPREIFEPLRLACETRNEKLMIASLDCISKLISYSFFSEDDAQVLHSMPSPPPSPGPTGRKSATGSHLAIPLPSLVDLVAHTITSCHTESTPDTVCLQIVKALLSLVLSPTVLIHHSSLLKAVRTVYNIFLLSTDQVNQMVAQGGLTQMVHHVFTRCRRENSLKASTDFDAGPDAPGSTLSLNREYFALPEFEVQSSLNGHTTATQVAVSTESSSSMINVSSNKVALSEMTASSSDLQENLTLYAFFSLVKPPYSFLLFQRQTFETSNPLDALPESEYNSHQLTLDDLFVKDAFLVFRALCKLTMKPLNSERCVLCYLNLLWLISLLF
jgi:brefeldin A-inhibited guanine nucleotide-exchange protein